MSSMQLPKGTRSAVLCLTFAAFTAPALAQPANDSCATPTAASGFGIVAWDSTNATTDGGPHSLCNGSGSAEIFNDIWFAWTATNTLPTVISACGFTGLDTKIALYNVTTCPTGEPIACNDDSACGLPSTVSFIATAGTTYLVRLGSYNAADTGSGSIEFRSGVIAGPIERDGHQYLLVSAADWTSAEAGATQLGGHLVTINDAAENEFVRAQVLGFDGADRRCWIGFNDVASEGNFAWSSGEPAAYSNWNPGEPNNSGGTENYAEMLGGNGEWNDVGNVHAPTQFAVIEIAGGPSCPADLDNDGNFANGGAPDGGVTIDDLLYFLAGFEAGSTAVDLDNGTNTGTQDDAVTVDDLLYFLIHFEAGC